MSHTWRMIPWSWSIAMVRFRPLAGVVLLPNGLNGLQMGVTNRLLSGMILQVGLTLLPQISGHNSMLCRKTSRSCTPPKRLDISTAGLPLLHGRFYGRATNESFSFSTFMVPHLKPVRSLGRLVMDEFFLGVELRLSSTTPTTKG